MSIKLRELKNVLSSNDYVIVRQYGKSFTYDFTSLLQSELFKLWANRLVNLKRTVKSNVFIVEA